eukprot:6025908-Prymnesium_polylepis.1
MRLPCFRPFLEEARLQSTPIPMAATTSPAGMRNSSSLSSIDIIQHHRPARSGTHRIGACEV